MSRARTTVAELAQKAGFTGQRLDAIRLAVSEAASNAVIHAYPDRPGEFDIRGVMAGGGLLVRITDNGCGLDAPSKHPGLGHGLGLIAASTDSCKAKRRTHGGTEVIMRWTLRPVPPYSD